MRRANPVIEFVGLPGSGKSTITRALPAEWPNSRSNDPAALPLSRRLAFYRDALPFMLSLRPLAAEDAHRLRKLAAELRYYERPAPAPLVIDQGMIQKLWSILLDRQRYDAAALERLVETKGVTTRAERAARIEEWDRAAKATPHGQPILLSRD